MLHIQYAEALWHEEPLVAARGEHGSASGADIYRQPANRLHCINDQIDAALSAPCADTRQIVAVAGMKCNVRQRYRPCPAVDMRSESFRVSVIGLQRDKADFDALAPKVEPSIGVVRMIPLYHQDVVAFFELNRIGGDIQSLRGVLGERDLVRYGAE